VEVASAKRHEGPAGARGFAYQRRAPETSLLYETVRANLKTVVAELDGDAGAGFPRFVISDFERYLRCGVLAHGFARVRCGACGDELLVAFSCKSRGLCPSCTTRRMQETALQLVDKVLPAVPTRQWVLSLPRRARFLLCVRSSAHHPDARPGAADNLHLAAQAREGAGRRALTSGRAALRPARETNRSATARARR